MSTTIRHSIAAVLVAAISIGAAAQGLGPKDGADLPATDLERVKPGVTAPDFTLEDQSGRPVTLSGFRDQRPVVLVFYRGHW
jgi:cytochrome oxidase Cu insertion factor (SCO1/SenC/PrrC family)